MNSPTAPTVQGVSMLRAFAASGEVGGAQLTYSNLETVAQQAGQRDHRLLAEFMAAPADSLEEERWARALALGYLVLTGRQLHTTGPNHQAEISARFTRHSIELYGEPDSDRANQLIGDQYNIFSRHIGDQAVDRHPLASVLSTLGGAERTHPAMRSETPAEAFRGVAEQIKGVLDRRHGHVLHLFDTVEHTDTPLNPNTVGDIFQQGLSALAAGDRAWANWKAERGSGEGMSTAPSRERISIGERGGYRPNRLKALFGHEALVHGGRSVQGYKTGDALLGKGLPGNLDAEEGIGILVEYALTGTIADKVTDRYIDVSLALGQSRLAALTRSQLHGLHASRQIVRTQAAGRPADIPSIERGAWNHVDRIYRGSLGTDIIGVNTKDIAYYQGFTRIAEYVQAEIVRTGDAEAVFDYIMSGCFDPTDARHRTYLATRHNLLPPPDRQR